MSDVKQLEQHLADQKALVERRDMAVKLSSNREFRKLIMEDFCLRDVARLANMAGDPATDPKEREHALEAAKAGGYLKRFLSAIILQGNTAERQIPEIDEALVEARAEEDDA